MSAFFCRKSAFFCKNGTFTQSNSLKAVRDFLVLFLVFVREKVTVDENDVLQTMRLKFDVIIQLFWRCFVSFVKFSYWFKFHVNIITGSGAMTIFFYKGLSKNLEIRNNRQISADWGKLGVPNLSRMSQRKCYWMLQNPRVTAFTVSVLLRENQIKEPLLPSNKPNDKT